jgi:hypothetical protein
MKLILLNLTLALALFALPWLWPVQLLILVCSIFVSDVPERTDPTPEEIDAYLLRHRVRRG